MKSENIFYSAIIILLILLIFVSSSPISYIANDKIKTVITNNETNITATVNEEGRLDVIQHSHIDTGAIHFHIADLTTGTYRYILIDMNDTINYPHNNTNYSHMEFLQVEVDGDNQGDYTVSFGFIENVNATWGDRYIIKHSSGSKTLGQAIRYYDYLSPSGWRLRKENIVTHAISYNDTNYQTDVLLPSTLSPSIADTYPGDGDMIMEVVVNAGTIDVAIDVGYHSH